MKQLDYELTTKLFECETIEELKQLHESGKDLETCSRLSIDEALGRLFNVRCYGRKPEAVQMLVDGILGKPIVQSSSKPDSNLFIEDNSVEQLDESTRLERISKRVDTITSSMSRFWNYYTKYLKDPELKKLNTTEEDLKLVTKSSEISLSGYGGSKKLYIMRREQDLIDQVLANGETLFL